MEAVIIVIGIVAVAVILIILGKSSWYTVETGSGSSATEMEAKGAFLKSENIKCRIKVAGSAGGANMGLVNSAESLASHSVIHLRVRKKDVRRAEQLLKQFGKEDEEFHIR